MKLSLAGFMTPRIARSGGDLTVESSRPCVGARPGRSLPTWRTPTASIEARRRWAAASGGLATWAPRPSPLKFWFTTRPESGEHSEA